LSAGTRPSTLPRHLNTQTRKESGYVEVRRVGGKNQPERRQKDEQNVRKSGQERRIKKQKKVGNLIERKHPKELPHPTKAGSICLKALEQNVMVVASHPSILGAKTKTSPNFELIELPPGLQPKRLHTEEAGKDIRGTKRGNQYMGRTVDCRAGPLPI